MRRRSFSILLSILVFLLSISVSKAQSGIRYVYVDGATIKLVDPTHPSVVAQIINISIPKEYAYPSLGLIEPMGKHMVLGFRNDGAKWFLKVISLLDTSQTYDVIQDASLDSVSWSPDGDTLGWVQYDNGSSSVKVYSNITHTVSTAVSNHAIPKQFTWALDYSQKIALSSVSCSPPTYLCRFNLATINVNTASTLKSIDATDIPQGFGSPYAVICDPHWSPPTSNGTMRFVSFVSECDTGTTKTLQDVFISGLYPYGGREKGNRIS